MRAVDRLGFRFDSTRQRHRAGRPKCRAALAASQQARAQVGAVARTARGSQASKCSGRRMESPFQRNRTTRRWAGSEVWAVGGAWTVRVGFGSVRRLAGQVTVSERVRSGWMPVRGHQLRRRKPQPAAHPARDGTFGHVAAGLPCRCLRLSHPCPAQGDAGRGQLVELELGVGVRLAGERCRSNSNWYWCRHIDSRRRGVSGERRTNSVPRNRKMRAGAS